MPVKEHGSVPVHTEWLERYEKLKRAISEIFPVETNVVFVIASADDGVFASNHTCCRGHAVEMLEEAADMIRGDRPIDQPTHH
jgi:hypothetical protein